MSEETNKILREIAERLKSIDERLGLVLTHSKGISLHPTKSCATKAENLFYTQHNFSNAESSVLSEIDKEGDQALLNHIDRAEGWELALGIKPPSGEGNPDILEEIDMGMTFADLGTHLRETFGVTKNKTRRYEFMRKNFASKRPYIDGSSPYNVFLKGKTKPSDLQIDGLVASILVGIILELLAEGRLSRKKNS